ncbi:unnamed protein product [Kuraishia capsulata CBS 1993]|uniref:RING-CH-type domain-containing protein n=1 Tax=Kuraishia capsulata CBS 1993 TaxID=1382522 RepID=W6MFX8_9ASCO|nr:uncharacterized protein KUCA_T00000283001 [Kuraishia capsulata CBS 1993]CDK24323.1 unnamed protein product [Kuraishia capsulata CBS 1993]
MNDTDQSSPRCWICLGEGDEVPPLGTKADAHDWIHPCACSLVAHRKCLLNWISNLDLQERRQGNGIAPRPANEGVFFNFPFAAPLVGVPLLGESQSIIVNCPQCKKQIFLKSSSGSLLNMRKVFQDCVSTLTRVTVISTLVSSTVASYALGMTAGCSASGMKILQTLAPNSVQLSLFDVRNTPSVIGAIDRGRLPMARFLLVTAAIPPYLYLLRKPFIPAMQEAFVQLFPFLFLTDGTSLLESGPKRNLLFIAPLKFVYGVLYKVTLNRVYYRWARSVQPCFIADGLSAETLEIIERENEEEFEIQQEDEEERIKLENSLQKTRNSLVILLKRFLHYLVPSDRIRQIRISRLKRELECCFKTDFGLLFSKPRFYYNIATTLAWPVLGEYASRELLAKIPFVVGLINRHVSTPDEATFLRNLAGCFAVVIASDLVSLFFAWRKVKQLQNIRVLKYGTKEWREASSNSITTDLTLMDRGNM